MNKILKWILLVFGGLVALVVIALIIIPMFVNLETLKPQIEKKVSEETGRPFTINGDLKLSLFPWAGISFSDLHLGNPAGFKQKDFLTVKYFDVQVKLFPLLSKDLQVKRFVLESPHIVLEKNRRGRGNWEDIAKSSKKIPAKTKKESPDQDKSKQAPFLKGIDVKKFAITDGYVLWIDSTTGARKEITDLILRINSVSLNKPIQFDLSARVNRQPFSLNGKLGPLGDEPGKGTIPLDVSANAFKEMDMRLKGKIIEPATRQAFDLDLQISPFSLRNVLTALNPDSPLETSDTKALSRVSLSVKIKGDPKRLTFSDGLMNLDDSKMTFSLNSKTLSATQIAFNADLDKIDLDQYLPPKSKKDSSEKKKSPELPVSGKKKTEYASLRRLVLDGTIHAGEIKAQGARVQDINLKISGRNGRFYLDPFTLRLYEGDMTAKGVMDVRQDALKSNMSIHLKDVQVKPLLKDVLEKEFLEGILQAEFDLQMSGDSGEMIKKTLNGKGDLLFLDGAIVGIDLGGMVQNIKAAFGLTEKKGKQPRTDFSKLHFPFTIVNGVLNTTQGELISPLIRVKASGNANLVKETLNFQIDPTFVATFKGQGDTKERSGLMVPVLASGTFDSPKFSPDLKRILSDGIEDEVKAIEDTAKDILKIFESDSSSGVTP